jgi:hypothetical protein
VLTRDDLLLPSAIVIAFAAWQLPRERRRRTLLILGGTVVAVVIGHEAFRLAYYGEALPNTYYLKLGGIPIRDRLLRGAESLLYAGLYSLAAPRVLAGAALFLWRRAAPLLLLAALFAAQCAYSVYVGGDAWEDLKFANRYVATAAPVLMVLAAVGGYEIASRALRSRSVAALGTLSFATLGVLLLILRAADRIPHSRLGLTGRPVTQLTPALLVLGCAAAIAVIGFAGRRDESHLRSARWGAGGALVLALLALASTSAGPAARWVRSNAQDTVVERLWTEMGVVIGEHTAPRARVAFVTAGNMPYFSQRPSVDLLGKMDPVVAHRPPTAIYPIRYRPGHNKWDYAYSIGRLRPQVVVSLWWQTRQDLCNMRRWGYEQIAPRLYVLRGAAGVDVPGLAAATERLGPGPGYPPAGAGCA